jgi:20S proteasome alpha/beta subunit
MRPVWHKDAWAALFLGHCHSMTYYDIAPPYTGAPFSVGTLVQLDTYNGSAIVAMAGDKCVAIGSDLRFGVQMKTMATDYHKLSQIHDRLFIGLSGLGTDQVRVLL